MLANRDHYNSFTTVLLHLDSSFCFLKVEDPCANKTTHRRRVCARLVSFCYFFGGQISAFLPISNIINIIVIKKIIKLVYYLMYHLIDQLLDQLLFLFNESLTEGPHLLIQLLLLI